MRKIVFLLILILASLYLFWWVFNNRLSDSVSGVSPITPDSTKQLNTVAETEIVNSTDSGKLALPTRTSINPSPSPVEFVSECPITQPNGSSPKYGEYYGFNHGNNAGTLYTVIPNGGSWVFWPGGPGEIRADGSLAIKWGWWRTIPGDTVITGQRLDGKAPAMPEVILRGEEDGYDETGFHPSRLVFPSEGCWEITARVGDERLSFVLLVILRKN